MKKSLLFSGTVLLLVLMFGSVAGAGTVLEGILKKGELVVGISGDQLPFSATTKEGEVVGLDADIARRIANNMNLKIRFSRMPFSDLLPALQSGKVDMVISGMTMTPERNTKVAFIGPYYVASKGILIKFKNVEKLKKEGLNSELFKVATLKASTSKEIVEKAAPKVKLVLVASYNEALDLLYQDKVDIVVADLPFCSYIAERYPEKNLAVGDTKLSFEPKGIAVLEDTLWLNGLENFLKLSIASGEMNALLEKWSKSGTWITLLP